VKIVLKNLQNKDRLGNGMIKKAAAMAASCFRSKFGRGQVNIYFVTDAFIRKLNYIYKKSQSATDVLAFDISGRRPSGMYLADIVISVDTAKKNAREYRTSLNYETCLYAVHGILHLAGFNDDTVSKRQLMQKKAAVILSKICPSIKPKP
jgi:probable rRNA maturation factor